MLECVCVCVLAGGQKLEDGQYQHYRRPEQPLIQTGGDIHLSYSKNDVLMMEHI